VTALAAGKLTAAQRRELWDCVFLTRDDLAELLAHVGRHPPRPGVPAMLAVAAMTGARRSEVVRLRWADVDLAGETLVLHEKKRARGKRTTRRVAMAPLLVAALQAWRAEAGGGGLVFPADPAADRPYDANAAHRLFRRAVRGTPWRHLRGWHVMRQSFVSNCAALGVDQRLIDEWVGHTTEEMRRRYRHLLPGQQQEALRRVFGDWYSSAGSLGLPRRAFAARRFLWPSAARRFRSRRQTDHRAISASSHARRSSRYTSTARPTGTVSPGVLPPDRSRCRARNHRARTDRAVWWCPPTHPRVSYSSSPHSPSAF
jgi:hypothetical protein